MEQGGVAFAGRAQPGQQRLASAFVSLRPVLLSPPDGFPLENKETFLLKARGSLSLLSGIYLPLCSLETLQHHILHSNLLLFGKEEP